MTTKIPYGSPNCPAARRIELLHFFAAQARLASDERACELCAEKHSEYLALPASKRPPDLAPCYIHRFERKLLCGGGR